MRKCTQVNFCRRIQIHHCLREQRLQGLRDGEILSHGESHRAYRSPHLRIHVNCPKRQLHRRRSIRESPRIGCVSQGIGCQRRQIPQVPWHYGLDQRASLIDCPLQRFSW